MGKFHDMKMLREVVIAWREVKNRNNEKRLQTHRIRDQLRQRPELARPLLVLKNMLAYKAFNKLFEGAHLLREED